MVILSARRKKSVRKNEPVFFFLYMRDHIFDNACTTLLTGNPITL